METTSTVLSHWMAVPEKTHIEIVYSALKPHAQKDFHFVFWRALNESKALGEEEQLCYLAEVLKKHADQAISPGWSCIVGPAYSAAFAFDSHVHHFLAGPHAVLLFHCV